MSGSVRSFSQMIVSLVTLNWCAMVRTESPSSTTYFLIASGTSGSRGVATLVGAMSITATVGCGIATSATASDCGGVASGVVATCRCDAPVTGCAAFGPPVAAADPAPRIAQQAPT